MLWPLVRKRWWRWQLGSLPVLWVLHDFNSSLFTLWTVSTIRNSPIVWAHGYFLTFSSLPRYELPSNSARGYAKGSSIHPATSTCETAPHLHILCTEETSIRRKAETGACINNASKMRALSRQTAPLEWGIQDLLSNTTRSQFRKTSKPYFTWIVQWTSDGTLIR